MVTGAEMLAGAGLDDALTRRQRAKSELDRLKSVIAACDAEIMTALTAEDDEFTRWALEVRGEIQSYENRKIKWTDPDTGEQYAVCKRKGSAPRRTIDPEKLLRHGVPANVIQASTTFGEPGKPGVMVRKVVKGMDDETDE